MIAAQKGTGHEHGSPFFSCLKSSGVQRSIDLDEDAPPKPSKDSCTVDIISDSDGEGSIPHNTARKPTSAHAKSSMDDFDFADLLDGGDDDDFSGFDAADFVLEEELISPLYRGQEGAVHTSNVKIETAGEISLDDMGGMPLTWAVVKPATSEEAANLTSTTGPAQRKRLQPAVDAAEQRLRKMAKRVSRPQKASSRASTVQQATKVGADSHDSAKQEAKFRARATPVLLETLGGGEHLKQVAAAIIDAFIQAHGVTASRRLLLDLVAALRRNPPLRDEVIVAGGQGARALARQDPAEWATKEVQAKRRQWAEEAMQKVKPAGPIAPCPICGGRAAVASGTAGSGRAGRLTKAFIHYSCMEPACGASSHVKQE